MAAAAPAQSQLPSRRGLETLLPGHSPKSRSGGLAARRAPRNATIKIAPPSGMPRRRRESRLAKWHRCDKPHPPSSYLAMEPRSVTSRRRTTERAPPAPLAGVRAKARGAKGRRVRRPAARPDAAASPRASEGGASVARRA